jgi:hypothetical protein
MLRFLRRLLQSRLARKILVGILSAVVAELSEAGPYNRPAYGNSPYDDDGVHTRW